MRRLISIISVLACGTFLPAWAAEIPIRNGGFEEFVLSCAPSSSCYSTTVPGWAETGAAYTWKVPANVFLNIPDGVNVVQLGSNTATTQTLNATLQHNMTYTLTFYVGHGLATFPGYKVELLAGTTTIASDASLAPATSTFATGRIVFQSANANPALIGQPLGIRLTGNRGGDTYFDKLSLDATPTIFSAAASQFASGGGWRTTLALVNLASTQSFVRVAFFSQGGQPLTVPVVVSPPIAAQSPIASFDTTIAPGATLLIESEGNAFTPTLVGWAQVTSSEPVSGFAIFRQRGADGRDSEGTTPINSENSSTLVLPFDNTAGFATGAALVNTTAIPVIINAKILDDTGAQIGLQAIALPPMGHLSFFLPDRFAITNGRRGIVQFQNATGGAIAATGLRFSPAGSFTSIPIVLE